MDKKLETLEEVKDYLLAELDTGKGYIIIGKYSLEREKSIMCFSGQGIEAYLDENFQANGVVFASPDLVKAANQKILTEDIFTKAYSVNTPAISETKIPADQAQTYVDWHLARFAECLAKSALQIEKHLVLPFNVDIKIKK